MTEEQVAAIDSVSDAAAAANKAMEIAEGKTAAVVYELGVLAKQAWLPPAVLKLLNEYRTAQVDMWNKTNDLGKAFNRLRELNGVEALRKSITRRAE